MPKDNKTKERTLDKIKAYIQRMPSFSTTMTKVLEICNNPSSSANDLNRVISLDPVLTGQVLRLINSAYYSLPSRVTSMSRAIVMLGMNTVRNLALSTAVLQTLEHSSVSKALPMDDFWTHSICTGVTAKALAAIKNVPFVNQEEYFVAGLLHDLGKIPLLGGLPDEYTHALATAATDQRPLWQVENEVIGFDHSRVGRWIAEKWNLGEAFNNAISLHHDPATASAATRQLTRLVSIANFFSNVSEIGASGDAFPEEEGVLRLLEQVEIPWETLTEMRGTVVEKIGDGRVFLEGRKRGAS